MADTYPTMTAWVVAPSPLTVKTAGAETAVPADEVDGLTLGADDRVTISVRTPDVPLVIALEEAL
jgi:hypothetical protein